MLRYRKHRHPFTQLQKLDEYAQQNHFSRGKVFYRLSKGYLEGYKIGGCWWIVVD